VTDPPALVIVFRAPSSVEASIVRGLLEAHDIPSLTSSTVPGSVFPFNVSGLGEVRILVHEGDSDRARRIIESHRSDLAPGQLIRIRDEFEVLQQAIDYRFRDRGLLEHALTHTSRANEDVSGGVIDNESLEFLGDAVLGLVIADVLFREFPNFDEGRKSKAKASLVSATTLALRAEALNLGEHLLLGRGEEKTGGRRKQALLADGYEALIAAIYLDGGIEQARAFIVREFAPLFADVRQHGMAGQDYKSALQEYLQSLDLALPEYRVVDAVGPDHRKLFRIEVSAQGQALADAIGPSKKEAEQEAARLALERLKR
jgi:ribonuclease-3